MVSAEGRAANYPELGLINKKEGYMGKPMTIKRGGVSVKGGGGAGVKIRLMNINKM